MTIQHILVVDDDPLSREFMVEAVASLGYQVSSATDGEQGLERVGSEHPDMVVTDLRMPGMDGLTLVDRMSTEHPGIPVVMVTAHGSVESATQAMRQGAVDFLLKPCTPESLELVVARVDRTQRLEGENAYLRSELVPTGEGIIAESEGMRGTLEKSQRVARSKGTVLITGESGTGKECVAHHVHRSSPRANAPFIRVNCAALSESLLESELFGHERGAFTGAHKSRQGRFELADGGTLLLDEIGEISPKLQAQLLRVLEEEEFERVGGANTLKVDVRVIASTNRDLASEVAAGNFREDLYYRLHVLPLHLQPLRERRADILPLAQHFASHYAAKNGVATPSLSRSASERLVAWHWPGNVRELENVMQRAIVLQCGDEVEAADLVFGPSASASASGPRGIVGAVPTRSDAVAPSAFTADSNAFLVNRRLADIEREAILATLASAGNNKTEAARRLGVSARTLSNKMKAWRAAGLVA